MIHRTKFTKRKTRAERVAFRVAERRATAKELAASREEWSRSRDEAATRDIQRLMDESSVVGKWGDYA